MRSTLLINPTESKTFTKVLNRIRHKIKPDSGPKVSSIQKTTSAAAVVELHPKTTSKITFCETFKGLLGESLGKS